MQKIAPVTLLIELTEIIVPAVLLIAIYRTLYGGVLGVNQVTIRSILAYSSMTHIGWVLTTAQARKKIREIIFINYLLSTAAIIFVLILTEPYINDQPLLSNASAPLSLKLTITFLILNIAGLPPLLGFFPKLIALKTVLAHGALTTGLFIVFSIVINIYYYLKIVFL